MLGISPELFIFILFFDFFMNELNLARFLYHPITISYEPPYTFIFYSSILTMTRMME